MCDPTKPRYHHVRKQRRENLCFKLLFGLLAREFRSYLENVHAIPTERYGLNLVAMLHRNGVQDIDGRRQKGIGHRAARYTRCSSISRRRSTRRLGRLTVAQVGVSLSALYVFAAILQESRIIVEDLVAEISLFTQMTGLAQRTNLSSFLFSIFLEGLPYQLGKPGKSVELILYLEDFVIYRSNRFRE